MTKAEKTHMDRIASMPCAVCSCFGVHVHHIRTGIGMGRKAWERHHGITELELLQKTKERMA